MNLPTSVDGPYFEWLYDQVGSEKRETYRDMLLTLYYITFRSRIPNDINRATDGIGLRLLFQKETGISMTFHEENRPCNVLEMLIALAVRMTFFTVFDPADMDDEDGPIDNFWLMISNLGLKPHTDRKNVEIINNFITRDYMSNGHGGLFPLRNPRENQREVELWYQMQEYIATEVY